MGRRSWVLSLAVTAIACSSGGGKGNTNTCTNQCASAGLTTCSGTLVQTCTAGAGGCLSWSAATACGTGLVCSAAQSACVPDGTGCTDLCASEGLTRCSGTLVQTCTTGVSGCRDWSAATACAAGSLCSSSANACVADVCQGVPAAGVCTNPTTRQFCATPTGDATPRVVTVSCGAGEQCQVVGGSATCVVTGVCRDGVTECSDATTLRTCTGGAWSPTPCAGSCSASPLGAFCVAAGTLTTFSGRVLFEAKVPNAGLTDWSSLGTYGAPQILVLSQGTGGVYDATYTSTLAGTEGEFTIRVPATPDAADRVVVAAAAANDTGGLAFAVANPGFSTGGEKQPGTVETPALWSWAWGTQALTPGQDLLITEAMGSGAVNVHFNLVRAYQVASQHYAGAAPSLITWLELGATWSCGACFAAVPASAFGMSFDTQIWIGGDPTDQAYWSDAVNSHELGHWAMASFGVSPGEGGPHFLGKPTFPGQAWSEGWGTWFSSAVRNDPLYFDKQSGSFFWVDINGASYSSGNAFVLPTPDAGLLQYLDENEVSAMLWSLSSAGGSAPVFQALASPRMTTPRAIRGYTRHTWAFDGSNNFINIVDTLQPALAFPDLLDALNCAGFSRTFIDAATVPATRYPYPSASPICN